MFTKICAKCQKEFQVARRNRSLCDECNKQNPEFTRDSKYKMELNLEDTEFISYFLGFLCSDGSINKSKKEVKFYSTDLEILEKIKERTKYTGPIYHVEKSKWYKGAKDVYELCYHANNATKIKELFDISSKDEQSIEEILKRYPSLQIYDFLRGFLDGDGSIILRKLKSGKQGLNNLLFLGRQKMIESIQRYLGYGKIFTRDLTGNRTKQMFNLNYAGVEAYELAHKLWDNSTIHMDRKYKKFLEIKEYKPRQIARRKLKTIRGA